MKNAHDLVAEAKSCTQEVALKDAEQAIREAAVLIDVREADEFAAGHLAGAILMPRGLLEFKLSAAPTLAARDLKVVLYCKTSGRAALAACATRAARRSLSPKRISSVATLSFSLITGTAPASSRRVSVAVALR